MRARTLVSLIGIAVGVAAWQIAVLLAPHSLIPGPFVVLRAILELAQRGLLESTLVIWGGEFGRLPISQPGDKPGRDHNQHANTVWLAGGGILFSILAYIVSQLVLA